MSRPKSSWADIANFGANVYQAKQMSNIANAQAEQNAMMQMQMEEMRQQQQMEQMQKEMLKVARSLILEFEDEINSIKKRIQINPILSSIQIEALDMAFNESKSNGVNSEFFDEIHDMERFRNVERNLEDLKRFNSSLDPEQLSIKNNIISYSSEFEYFERAISLGETLPIIGQRHRELSQECSQLRPRWDDFERNAIELNSEISKKENILVGIVSMIALPIILIMLLSPELVGIQPGSDLEAEIGGGACLAWIILGFISISIFDSKKIDIPSAEALLGESNDTVEEIQKEIEMYRSMDQELFSEEIENLELKLKSITSSDMDLNFVVPHSGEPFAEYFIILENTFNKCDAQMKTMSNEFNQLSSVLGISDLSQLKSDFDTKRQYVDYYTSETLRQNIPTTIVETSPQQVTWVSHTDGYYYKQFQNGNLDSVPHIKGQDGSFVPYHLPKPPLNDTIPHAQETPQVQGLDLPSSNAATNIDQATFNPPQMKPPTNNNNQSDDFSNLLDDFDF